MPNKFATYGMRQQVKRGDITIEEALALANEPKFRAWLLRRKDKKKT